MAEDNYMPPKQADETKGPDLTPEQRIIVAMATRLMLQQGMWKALFISDAEMNNARGLRIEGAKHNGEEGWVITAKTHSEAVKSRLAANGVTGSVGD
jgi:hypothetical protein